MSVKLRDITTKMIKEDDGTYSVTCSALGVYSSGKTKQEAKSNFSNALELHLSMLKEKATKVITR